MNKPKAQAVRKWGNGLGIFLSKTLAEAVGFEIGTEISPEVKSRGKLVFTSEKASAAVSVTDFNEFVLIEIDGVSIPLRRETAKALASKSGSRDGFADAGDFTELSVTPAGCLKLKLDPEAARALRQRLRDLEP